MRNRLLKHIKERRTDQLLLGIDERPPGAKELSKKQSAHLLDQARTTDCQKFSTAGRFVRLADY